MVGQPDYVGINIISYFGNYVGHIQGILLQGILLLRHGSSTWLLSFQGVTHRHNIQKSKGSRGSISWM